MIGRNSGFQAIFFHVTISLSAAEYQLSMYERSHQNILAISYASWLDDMYMGRGQGWIETV